MDSDEQIRSGFRYDYSVYQVEYSRNLLFRSGAQMDRVFDTVLDRVRTRLDVPILRTLFGAKQRPGRSPFEPSMQLAAVIEKPRYDLTLFKVHFGLLTLKGYTKGEHVLRFEAITHNTRQLGCGRVLTKFPDIVARLTGMLERFTSALDCVDIGFIPDGLLDRLPQPAQIGPRRTAGVDLNRPRMRTTLAAVLVSTPAPTGFTVADLTCKVNALDPDSGYTTRQAPTTCASNAAKISSNDRASHTAAKRLPKPHG